MLVQHKRKFLNPTLCTDLFSPLARVTLVTKIREAPHQQLLRLVCMRAWVCICTCDFQRLSAKSGCTILLPTYDRHLKYLSCSCLPLPLPTPFSLLPHHPDLQVLVQLRARDSTAFDSRDTSAGLPCRRCLCVNTGEWNPGQAPQDDCQRQLSNQRCRLRRL